MGTLGIHSTVRLAAAINVAVGLSALLAAGYGAATARGPGDRANAHLPRSVAPVQPSTELPGKDSGESAAVGRVVFWAFGLSGCLSLAYEVVWSRMLAMFFDSSVYGFTVMLTTVLCAISAGSAAIAPFIHRRWNWVAVFAGLKLVVAITAVLSILIIGELYSLSSWLQQAAGLQEMLSTPVRFMAFVSFVAIFPPMFLLGMTFPVAARIYATTAADAGQRVGAIYAANVCGAIFGSLIAGFVLVHLGSQGSLVLLAMGNTLIGLAILWTQRRRLGRRLAVVVVPLAALGLLLQLAPAIYPTIFRGRFPGQGGALVRRRPGEYGQRRARCRGLPHPVHQQP